MSEITLQYPYKERWDKGYIVTNGEGRKTLCLYNSQEDRSSTSYSRYLMSVELGRHLLETEHVDHIDNDKTNDILSNLQILTQAQNNAKEGKRKGRVLVELACPSCKEVFTRRKGSTHLVPSLKGKITSCSKVCGHKMSVMKLSLSERIEISDKSVLRVYTSNT